MIPKVPLNAWAVIISALFVGPLYSLNNIPADDPTDTDGDGLPDEYELRYPACLDPNFPNLGDADGDGLSNILEGQIGTNPCSRDTDGDGIDDNEEISTDPRKADTDDDGLTDYQELFVYNTDPTREDTDNDGLTDGDEILVLSTNPLETDSDSDGLDDGYEVNTLGTNPLSLDTDDDGINDNDETITDPTKEDTDDDGLADYLELFRYKTDPTREDTDNDGLIDSDEVFVFNTNPVRADSDSDGLDDGYEVNTLGTDPLSRDTDEDGLDDAFEDADSRLSPLNEDTDGDSLLDPQEIYVYFTDPQDTDSDDDGLNDYEEVFSYGTNPIDQDSDDDSLIDGDEILVHNSDPLSVDTDGDLLPDGQEIAYGLDINEWDIFRDDDRDGYPAIFEWIFGADPTLASSTPEVGDSPLISGFTSQVVSIVGQGSLPEQMDSSVLQSLMDGLSDFSVILLRDVEFTSERTLNIPSDKSLLVLSLGGPESVIFRKTGNDGAVLQTNSPIVLSGIGFVGGFSGSTGGSLLIDFEQDGNVVVKASSFSESEALLGGDFIAVQNGSLIIQESTFVTPRGKAWGSSVYFSGTARESYILSSTFRDVRPSISGVQDALWVFDSIIGNHSDASLGSDNSLFSQQLGYRGYATQYLPIINNGTSRLPGYLPAIQDVHGETRAATQLQAGFDVFQDQDTDGLPDFLEALAVVDPLGDNDGDTLLNLEEFEYGLNPLSPDTDGDGLSDGFEYSAGRNLSPGDDTDTDGLSNLEEQDAGTDPLEKDTDGDGMGDYYEILLGLDPLDDGTIDPVRQGAGGDFDGDGTPNSLDPNPADDSITDTTNDLIRFITPGNGEV